MHTIDIGAKVPRGGRRVLQWLALRVLSLYGWRLDMHLPDEPKLMVLAAPHTSNWDGFFAILAMLAMDLRLGLFVKHSAFKGPLGRVLRKLDAIPVDRRAAGGVIGQTVKA